MTFSIQRRMLIWMAMLLIAPLLSAPSGGIAATFGWVVFDAWDSVDYRAIAYEFVDDGNAHNLAFFSLFALIILVFIHAQRRFVNQHTLCLRWYLLIVALTHSSDTTYTDLWFLLE